MTRLKLVDLQCASVKPHFLTGSIFTLDPVASATNDFHPLSAVTKPHHVARMDQCLIVICRSMNPKHLRVKPMGHEAGRSPPHTANHVPVDLLDRQIWGRPSSRQRAGQYDDVP